jgi:hypothetical protein
MHKDNLRIAQTGEDLCLLYVFRATFVVAMSVEACVQTVGGSSAGWSTEGSLEVVVLHTTIPGTLASLKRAAELASGLAASIRLVVLTIVPYPLTIESPQVPLAFTRRRFTTIASEARVDTLVDIRLGRDRMSMIESALRPRSVVVLERRRSWWPNPTRKLAKRLERLGHQIVYSN